MLSHFSCVCLKPYELKPARLLYPQGFSSQEYWSGLSCSPSGDLPDPEIELMSPALAGGFFITKATCKAQNTSI